MHACVYTRMQARGGGRYIGGDRWKLGGWRQRCASHSLLYSLAEAVLAGARMGSGFHARKYSLPSGIISWRAFGDVKDAISRGRLPSVSFKAPTTTGVFLPNAREAVEGRDEMADLGGADEGGASAPAAERGSTRRRTAFAAELPISCDE
mmetsp:Transcript_34196/g.88311  ORF Transcript_34196/g.88311 Transcript_34196/m.88311 type:complete len:150 (+) Transcript_34196:2223-2672(+)